MMCSFLYGKIPLKSLALSLLRAPWNKVKICCTFNRKNCFPLVNNLEGREFLGCLMMWQIKMKTKTLRPMFVELFFTLSDFLNALHKYFYWKYLEIKYV